MSTHASFWFPTVLKFLDRLDQLIHDSETVKRALREKHEGILIDGQKKRKSTKKDKDSLKKYVCKHSKILLGVRYNERENNKIVTLGPN